MDTSILIDRVACIFETSDGKTELKIKAETTPSTDNKPKKLPLPHVWLITRGNGVPLFALKPEATDVQFRILTAEKLYAEKIQWFEPLADSYRKIIWVNPESTTVGSDSYSAYKQFTWAQIIKFAIVDRVSISFAPKMPGDWKNSSEGVAGFLMVLIEGEPYWADGVGQIPFATDTYRLYLEESKQPDVAINKTVKAGMTYGDGIPIFPKEDKTNEYDNYMVLRGALWASDNFELRTETVRVFAGRMGYREKIVTRTIYLGVSDQKLRSSITQGAVDNHGEWKK